MTSSFRILPNSLSINQPTNRRLFVWGTKSVDKETTNKLAYLAVRLQIMKDAPMNVSIYNLLIFNAFIYHMPVFYSDVSSLTAFGHNKTCIRSYCTNVGCKTTIWQTSFCQNHPADNWQTVSKDKVVPAHVLYLFLTSALDVSERPLHFRERTLVSAE